MTPGDRFGASAPRSAESASWKVAGGDAAQVEHRQQRVEAPRAAGPSRQDVRREPDLLAARHVRSAVPDLRPPDLEGADPGLDLALGPVPVPNHALPAIRQPLLGELAEKGLDLGFERGREHPARTFPGDLGERVLDGTRLAQRDDAGIVLHGVSLLLEVLAGSTPATIRRPLNSHHPSSAIARDLIQKSQPPPTVDARRGSCQLRHHHVAAARHEPAGAQIDDTRRRVQQHRIGVPNGRRRGEARIATGDALDRTERALACYAAGARRRVGLRPPRDDRPAGSTRAPCRARRVPSALRSRASSDPRRRHGAARTLSLRRMCRREHPRSAEAPQCRLRSVRPPVLRLLVAAAEPLEIRCSRRSLSGGRRQAEFQSRIVVHASKCVARPSPMRRTQ